VVSKLAESGRMLLDLDIGTTDLNLMPRSQGITELTFMVSRETHTTCRTDYV
jgi:hypothetical protein